MKRLNILVAEDDPKIRELYQGIFTFAGWGHEYRFAADGQEAIELLERERFDLVITDRRMPRKSGEEVVRFAKSLDPAPKVLMAFGDIPEVVRAVAVAAGADAYLNKPFTSDELEAAIERFCADCSG